KVHGSEVLDYVVDEGVQIHGGNGFSDEYPISRAYRDSRINRIFEGTNEINRLLSVDMILKRAMKGQLDLMGPAMNVQKELMSIPEFGDGEEGAFSTELKTIANMKKSILMVAGAAVQKLMTALSKEQEIIMNIADMMIETFVAESMLLRVIKSVERTGKEAINSFATGDEQRMMLLGLKRFTKTAPFNAKDARRLIAAKLIEDGRYS